MVFPGRWIDRKQEQTEELAKKVLPVDTCNHRKWWIKETIQRPNGNEEGVPGFCPACFALTLDWMTQWKYRYSDRYEYDQKAKEEEEDD